MKMLFKLHRWLLQTETVLLVGLLLAMILIAVIQVAMRNVIGGGLLWADAFTRISVLWIAMIGAMAAARQRNHIAIDVWVRAMPASWKQWITRCTDALTGLVCFAASGFSLDFVRQEAGYGEMAFGAIPAWWCESIIPIALAVIALRYSIGALLPPIASE